MAEPSNCAPMHSFEASEKQEPRVWKPIVRPTRARTLRTGYRRPFVASVATDTHPIAQEVTALRSSGSPLGPLADIAGTFALGADYHCKTNSETEVKTIIDVPLS